MSHHVVGRTEQLPSELIVNSQGTEIFSQSFLGSVVLIILPNWTQLLGRLIMLCTGLTFILWIGL